MADPFSVAASALAVASAGITLANALKTYIDSVRKIEKQLRPIIDHVKLTSNVLANVGSLLHNDEIRQLYTVDLLASTKDALDGCQAAFNRLKEFVARLVKADETGKYGLSSTAKLTFNFKLKELDVLHAHLERFKSSLDLVLGVLNLAISARNAIDSSVLLAMKTDIRHLMSMHDEAKRNETLVTVPVVDKASQAERSCSIEEDEALSITPIPAASFHGFDTTLLHDAGNSGLPVSAPNTNASSSAPEPKPYSQQDNSRDLMPTTKAEDRGRKIVQGAPHLSIAHTMHFPYLERSYLDNLANATKQLSVEIDKVVKLWDQVALYEPGCLEPTFRSARKAFIELEAYETMELTGEKLYAVNRSTRLYPPVDHIRHSRRRTPRRLAADQAAYNTRIKRRLTDIIGVVYIPFCLLRSRRRLADHEARRPSETDSCAVNESRNESPHSKCQHVYPKAELEGDMEFRPETEDAGAVDTSVEISEETIPASDEQGSVDDLTVVDDLLRKWVTIEI